MQWWNKRKLKLPVWAWVGVACAVTLFSVACYYRTELDRWAGRRVTALLDDGHVRVTPSEETTRICAPLRSDGYVDYLAALDQRANEGITSENNSAILFWQAVGPTQLGTITRAEFFKRLGTDDIPPDGDYLVTLENYVRKSVAPALQPEAYADANGQWEVIRKRPWTANVYKSQAELEYMAAVPLELSRVACALERFHAQHRSYPPTLEPLLPDYLAQLAIDPFTDAPFYYAAQANGYRLASAAPELPGGPVQPGGTASFLCIEVQASQPSYQ